MESLRIIQSKIAATYLGLSTLNYTAQIWNQQNCLQSITIENWISEHCLRTLIWNSNTNWFHLLHLLGIFHCDIHIHTLFVMKTI